MYREATPKRVRRPGSCQLTPEPVPVDRQDAEDFLERLGADPAAVTRVDEDRQEAVGIDCPVAPVVIVFAEDLVKKMEVGVGHFYLSLHESCQSRVPESLPGLAQGRLGGPRDRQRRRVPLGFCQRGTGAAECLELLLLAAGVLVPPAG